MQKIEPINLDELSPEAKERLEMFCETFARGLRQRFIEESKKIMKQESA